MHSSLTLTGVPNIANDITESGKKNIARDSPLYTGSTECQEVLRRWLNELADSSSTILTAFANSGPVPTPQSLLTTISSPSVQQQCNPDSSVLGQARLLRRLQAISSAPSTLHNWQSYPKQPGERAYQNNIIPSLLSNQPMKFNSLVSEPVQNTSEVDALINVQDKFGGSKYTLPTQMDNTPNDSPTTWLHLMLAIQKVLINIASSGITKCQQDSLCQMSTQGVTEMSHQELFQQPNFPLQATASPARQCLRNYGQLHLATPPTAYSQLQTLMWLLGRRTPSPPADSLLADGSGLHTLSNGYAVNNPPQTSSSSRLSSELPNACYSPIIPMQNGRINLANSEETLAELRDLQNAHHKEKINSDDAHPKASGWEEVDRAQGLTLNEAMNFNTTEFDDTVQIHTEPHKKRGADAGTHRKISRKTHTSHRTSFRLSQFLRHLLNRSDCNPHLICWVDKTQNTFKLVNSSAVARLWGLHKQKPNMNYETMGRAMRYYYAQNILRKVKGQRLVYQFLEEPSTKSVERNIDECPVKMDISL